PWSAARWSITSCTDTHVPKAYQGKFFKEQGICSARSVTWGRSVFVGPVRTPQRNLHHQLLHSGVLISRSLHAEVPLPHAARSYVFRTNASRIRSGVKG